VAGLIVAAGGGGDAITAALIAEAVGIPKPAPVLTYSWDRLMIDPLPGPRVPADFTGLRELAPGLHEITADTRPVPPAGSSLPRLAAELPLRVLLFDPTHGAVGMAEQVSAAAAFFQADEVFVLDVGGDILTDGKDPGLRSPLADQLALAAVLRTGLPGKVLIAGAGLDGEIAPDVLSRRIHDLGGQPLKAMPEVGLDQVGHVLRWHPSEASGMFAAAARGVRGRVQVRDAGDIVELNDVCALVYELELSAVAAIVPAPKLTDSESLGEAEKSICDVTGLSELVYERSKASRSRVDEKPSVSLDLERLDRLAEAVRDAGADYISLRRLAELAGVRTPSTYDVFVRTVEARRRERLEMSLYRT
jgi:hypothetical protein